MSTHDAGSGQAPRGARARPPAPAPGQRTGPLRRHALVALLAALSVLGAAGCGHNGPSVRVRAGSGTVRAELAVTPEQRSLGLMYRKELGEDDGMLFVFADDKERSFWMRNTLVPLSIAYLDADRKIVRIRDMMPLVENGYSSGRPARYALEVNKGWFSEHGVTEGQTLEFELPADLAVEP